MKDPKKKSKNTPQPRTSHIFGFEGPPSYLGDTWIEAETDQVRRARVRFPDGKLRVVYCNGVADTVFSVPSTNYSGYITVRDFNEVSEYVFEPYLKAEEKYGSWKNICSPI